MGYFDGQVAWVTGAGRGIGRAAALALASQGAAVAVVSRTQSEMDEVIAEVRFTRRQGDFLVVGCEQLGYGELDGAADRGGVGADRYSHQQRRGVGTAG